MSRGLIKSQQHRAQTWQARCHFPPDWAEPERAAAGGRQPKSGVRSERGLRARAPPLLLPGCRVPSVLLCQRAAWSWCTPGSCAPSRSPAPLNVVAEEAVASLSAWRRGSPLPGRGSVQPSSAAVLVALLKEAGQCSSVALHESRCLVTTAKYADNGNDKVALVARSHPRSWWRRTLQRDYGSAALMLYWFAEPAPLLLLRVLLSECSESACSARRSSNLWSRCPIHP